ncbi:MAG: hypothetical protein OEZ36_03740 [Spirochaetota bacterium]|nr:hypothetical protein [Spirochaetota bacterium]
MHRLIKPLLALTIITVFFYQEAKADDTLPQETTDEDLVSRGWKLVKRWDFHYKMDGWEHKELVDNDGYVLVENGMLGFGYANGKGLIYHANKVKVVPNYTYMVVAKVRTSHPQRASVGLYDPKSKTMHGVVRVKSKNWQIVKSIVSIEPTTGERPKALYPAFQTEKVDDYCEVDWVEFWILPKDKPEYVENNIFEDLYFPKAKPPVKYPGALYFKFGLSLLYRSNDDIMDNPDGNSSISFLKILTEDQISAIEIEIGAFPYRWDDANGLTTNYSITFYLSAFYVANLKVASFFKIMPKIGLGYGLMRSESSDQLWTVTETYLSSTVFLIPALTLDFRISRGFSIFLENKMMIGQITSLPFGDLDFVYLPNVGFSYNF